MNAQELIEFYEKKVRSLEMTIEYYQVENVSLREELSAREDVLDGLSSQIKEAFHGAEVIL